MRLRRGIPPTENIKNDAKKRKDLDTQQKYEEETDRSIQISEQDSIEDLWTNIEEEYKQ